MSEYPEMQMIASTYMKTWKIPEIIFLEYFGWKTYDIKSQQPKQSEKTHFLTENAIKLMRPDLFVEIILLPIISISYCPSKEKIKEKSNIRNGCDDICLIQKMGIQDLLCVRETCQHGVVSITFSSE